MSRRLTTITLAIGTVVLVAVFARSLTSERQSAGETVAKLASQGSVVVSSKTHPDTESQSENLVSLRASDEQGEGETFRSLVGASIAWKPDDTDLPPLNIHGHDYDELFRLANQEDDIYASLILDLAWSSCYGMPRTEAELEEETQSVLDLFARSYGHSFEEQQRIAEGVRQNYETCRIVDRVLEGDETDYAKKAAEAGSIQGMAIYGARAMRSDPDLARSYLLSVWHFGRWMGLERLAMVEEIRFESGLDPNARIEAVAYYAVRAAIFEAFMERVGGDSTQTVALAKARINELLPNERGAALARAKEIIESNTECCRIPFD